MPKAFVFDQNCSDLFRTSNPQYIMYIIYVDNASGRQTNINIGLYGKTTIDMIKHKFSRSDHFLCCMSFNLLYLLQFSVILHKL